MIPLTEEQRKALERSLYAPLDRTFEAIGNDIEELRGHVKQLEKALNLILEAIQKP